MIYFELDLATKFRKYQIYQVIFVRIQQKKIYILSLNLTKLNITQFVECSVLELKFCKYWQISKPQFEHPSSNEPGGKGGAIRSTYSAIKIKKKIVAQFPTLEIYAHQIYSSLQNVVDNLANNGHFGGKCFNF